jgi:DNA-binding MarR family transcriptional regulator
VERTEDPVDRRAKQLKLTAKGNALVQEGIEVRRHWMENLSITLKFREQDEIIAALKILTNAAKKLEPINNQIQ